jgi:hypothetical protein
MLPPGAQLPWAPHWTWLLQPFSTDVAANRLSAIQLGDDRCTTLAFVAIDDPRNALSRGDMMRLCFADDPGIWTLPYASGFMKDFENRYCYDRFWGSESEHGDLQSRIMICGYAYTYLGNAKDLGFFMDRAAGAHAIFRHAHVKMALVALFQKTSLLSAAWRLAKLSNFDEAGVPNQPNKQELDLFYRYFTMFSQKYWFDEISPQEQAREIFAKWRKELRIQELYNEVRQELRDIVEHVQTTESVELSRLATFGLPIALTLALLGITSFDKIVNPYAEDFKSSLLVLNVVVGGFFFLGILGWWYVRRLAGRSNTGKRSMKGPTK